MLVGDDLLHDNDSGTWQRRLEIVFCSFRHMSTSHMLKQLISLIDL
jgi:hypothetical protein